MDEHVFRNTRCLTYRNARISLWRQLFLVYLKLCACTEWLTNVSDAKYRGSRVMNGWRKWKEFFTLTMIVIIPFEIVYHPSCFPLRSISKRKNTNFCLSSETGVADSSEDLDCGLLGYDAVYVYKWWRTFARKLLPPSSGMFLQNFHNYELCVVRTKKKTQSYFCHLFCVGAAV
jgi:hypothetical protein